MLSDKEMAERFQDALDVGHNFFEISDVAAKVRSGEWQWHQNRDGVCITSIGENARGQRYLQGRFIFGDMDAVMEMSDRIDDFAKSHGCVGFLMDGRVGWTKILKKYGWQVAGVIMRKEY